MAEARKVKSEFHLATARARDLVATIAGGDASWSWANTDAATTDLRNALRELEERAVPLKRMLLEEIRTLKAEMKEAELMAGLLKLIELRACIVACNRERNALLQMKRIKCTE